jgi:tetraacyldisaccharide 4'-kinase
MKLKKPKFWDNPKLSIWSILFFPFSLIYFFLSYIKQLKRSKKFHVPIVCVGNIYLGGTGKTPLAKEIFKITKSLGKNPAFVKKYYDYLEDEIKMLEGMGKTFAAKERAEGIELLIKNNNDIAILDDGFQDSSIRKSFSILCFNQKQWIGNGFLIPSGPLRERLSSIKRADCIVINGDKDNIIENQINEIKQLKIFYTKYKPKNLEILKDKKIFAFAGIGNPLNFFELLKKNNLQLLNYQSFPDHYNYKKKDLDTLKSKAKELNALLLTTEKDYCRIDIDFRKGIEKLDVDLEIDSKEEFINLIKKSI